MLVHTAFYAMRPIIIFTDGFSERSIGRTRFTEMIKSKWTKNSINGQKNSCISDLLVYTELSGIS